MILFDYKTFNDQVNVNFYDIFSYFYLFSPNGTKVHPEQRLILLGQIYQETSKGWPSEDGAKRKKKYEKEYENGVHTGFSERLITKDRENKICIKERRELSP